MPALVSIIIPAFNELDCCVQCVNSIVQNTRPPYKLILVDNCSTDGVAEFFDSVNGAEVLHADTNKGFPGGANLGMAKAEGHVLLLNSDTIVPEGWLDELEAVLLSAPDIGMVGPMSNCVSGAQMIDGLSFSSMEEINTYAQKLLDKSSGASLDAERLVGFCALIRDEAFEKVGMLDERFGIGNFEDDDYGIRLRQAGYRLCIATGAFVFHYGHRTFSSMGIEGEAFADLMERNEKAFAEKWIGLSPISEHNIEEARKLNLKAEKAIQDEDNIAALEFIAQAMRQHPKNPDTHNILGVLHWQLGNHRKAVESFKKALQHAPEHEGAAANLRDAQETINRETKTT